MWALIGVWKIDSSVINELRAQVSLMASSNVAEVGAESSIADPD